MTDNQVKKVQTDKDTHHQLLEQARKIIGKTDYPSATYLKKEMRIPFDQATYLFNTLKDENILDEKTWRIGKKIDDVILNAVEKTTNTKKNVIAVRVTDKILEILDELVTFSIAQSRSEVAYMLIVEGIKAQSDFLAKLSLKKDDMENLRKSVLSETNISDFGRM